MKKDKISDKSRTVALILVILIGTLGVHRMYLGKIGTGIVQLLFLISWILIPILIIWVIIDLIMIATGSMKDAKGKYVFRWNEEVED